MVFKLRTSKETMEIFEELRGSIHLQPFALCKISVSLSIRINKPLEEKDFNTDTNGLELNRQTITGEYDELFKSLIIQDANISLSDEDYFPKYLKAHIDRGAKILLSEFRYSNNNFYQHMIEIDKGV